MDPDPGSESSWNRFEIPVILIPTAKIENLRKSTVTDPNSGLGSTWIGSGSWNSNSKGKKRMKNLELCPLRIRNPRFEPAWLGSGSWNQKPGKEKSKFELYRHESGSQAPKPLELDSDQETGVSGRKQKSNHLSCTVTNPDFRIRTHLNQVWILKSKLKR